MFARHQKEFAEVKSNLAVKGAVISLGDATMLETRTGWMPVAELTRGDAVATLDGGFAPISWISEDRVARSAMLVPAGALDNCSDIYLPADALIAIEAPLDFQEAKSDHVSMPLSALEGYRGIRRDEDIVMTTRTLGFAEEEMLWAQTGLLIHARPMTDAFFQTLSFAESRAVLALIEAGAYPLTKAA
ncbi:hypothetical protein E4Z66_04850 [Aliishimia ponticola]|uniref:Hedgehog/Intein (Hint) domain-containing protein n=1 Tax=Aliishimia ponticola TaxID=2499833 RepID=A0A4S4NRP4_9RHOB|nr:Hint domain-containing protein [Aliishimia ponticola]THH38890.1 hypothetical protein E4Z66_04850 [Aliishimia ponticola]